MPPAGLYVHVPFCSAICTYCNFNRSLFDGALKGRYLRAVGDDLRRTGRDLAAGGDPIAVDTIYFGGGTPSLLVPDEVGAILAACRDAFAVDPAAEVTLEANPETVSVGLLTAMRAHGVNRLSFGVQSFRDDELRRLGRIHSAARAVRAVDEARAAGFDNLSLDLMMWLPGQSLADWDVSLQGLIALAPEHASLYMLELYPNAPLKEDMARAGWSQVPDDDAAAMYERAMSLLEEAGYCQYEISNLARPGRESRHNLKYWTDGEWIGVGPGAHSTWRGCRWKTVAGTADYAARIEAGDDARVEHRVLSPDDRWREALMMGLRLVDGVSLAVFRSTYGLDLQARYGDDLRRFHEAGLVADDDERVRLTGRGRLLANEVLAVFF